MEKIVTTMEMVLKMKVSIAGVFRKVLDKPILLLSYIIQRARSFGNTSKSKRKTKAPNINS